MFKRLILLLFILAGVKAEAQEVTIGKIDSVTYDLYLKGSWRRITAIGKKAMKYHKDFYYLYYRMGISYYNLKEYRLAQKYFEKAYKFNHYDDWLNNWEYDALLANERYDEAFRWSRKFSDTTARFFHIKRPAFINAIDAYGAEQFPNNTQFFGNKLLGGVGLNHRVGRGISLYHYFSYLSQKFTILNIYQWQYYLQANIPLTPTFTVQPAASIIYFSATSNGQDPAIKNIGNYTYLGSLNFVKSFPLFDINITPSASNFYRPPDTAQVQLQMEGGFTIYPFYSRMLKLTYQFTVQQTMPQVSYHTGQFGAIGITPFRWFQFTASCFGGNVKYNNEFNGYIVNNSPDLLIFRYAFQAEFQIFAFLKIYVLYSDENRDGTYFNGPPPGAPVNFNYFNQLVLTGIKILL